MPLFRYTATDASGQTVSGTVDAKGMDAARSDLAGQGLRIQSLVDLTIEKVSRKEAEEIGQHIADLTSAGLPVSDGLRALANELSSESWFPTRTPGWLRAIASRLDLGEALPDVMARYRTPDDLRSIITAGMRTGRTPEAVGEYTAHTRAVNATSRFAAIAIAYPLMVMVAVMGIATFVFGAVVPQFKTIFEGFEVELPALTRVVIEISDLFQPLLAPFTGSVTTMIVATIVFLTFLVSLPWIIWRSVSINIATKRFRNRLPVIGSVFQWSSMAKFSHLIAVLIDHHVPLPEALRYAGKGSEDPDIEDACDDLAQQIDAGEKPVLVRTPDGFPTGFLQLLAAQSDREGIPEAMHSVANMYESRMRMHSAVIGAFMEPFILIFVIGVPVAVIVLSLFLPLIKLINDLS